MRTINQIKKKMQYFKIILSSICLLGIGMSGLDAQETILPTGGDMLGSGGTVCYSIGQIVYNTYTGADLSVTDVVLLSEFGKISSVAEGVQQSNEISVVKEIKKIESEELEVLSYPNPSIDFVYLKVEMYKKGNLKTENYEKDNLSYQLFDLAGRLLDSKKIIGNETKIVLSSFVPGYYYLKVTQNDKIAKTIKIYKK